MPDPTRVKVSSKTPDALAPGHRARVRVLLSSTGRPRNCQPTSKSATSVWAEWSHLQRGGPCNSTWGCRVGINSRLAAERGVGSSEALGRRGS